MRHAERSKACAEIIVSVQAVSTYITLGGFASSDRHGACPYNSLGIFGWDSLICQFADSDHRNTTRYRKSPHNVDVFPRRVQNHCHPLHCQRDNYTKGSPFPPHRTAVPSNKSKTLPVEMRHLLLARATQQTRLFPPWVILVLKFHPKNSKSPISLGGLSVAMMGDGFSGMMVVCGFKGVHRSKMGTKWVNAPRQIG